jgi:hypothetical protein
VCRKGSVLYACGTAPSFLGQRASVAIALQSPSNEKGQRA